MQFESIEDDITYAYLFGRPQSEHLDPPRVKDRVEGDLLHDSMIRLQEYTGIDAGDGGDLIDADFATVPTIPIACTRSRPTVGW